MTSSRDFATRRLLHPWCAATLAAFAGAAAVAQAPIVNPGAPGAAARTLNADEAIALARTAYTSADVQFLRDMMPHHQQAIDMAALAKDRTNRKELLDAAGRIDASQKDEIEFMQKWLEERNELGAASSATATADHAEHSAPTTSTAATAGTPAAGTSAPDHAAHGGMKGMATPEQMAELAASEGTDFDRLFLSLMITHHEGAVKMVEKLLELPGAAYDPVLFEFTSDVTNDQNAEIERMNTLLVSLSTDPRAGLKAGLDDAGQAILNLALVGTLPKPPGFFDPRNPGELPSQYLQTETQRNRPATTRWTEEGDRDGTMQRYPLLSFSNTDMAFAGDVLVAGSYHGFNVYRLPEDGLPKLLSSVVCPGGQGDVSIVGDLLIMSVEQTRGRLDCGLEGISVDVSADRFRGIRIFNISDLRGRCKLARSRPAVARTRIRSSPVRATTAKSSCTTPVLRPCAKKMRWKAASAKHPVTIEPRCFAST